VTQRVARFTPIRVTPEGVIIDGHHAVRAAAVAGVPVNVSVVPNDLNVLPNPNHSNIMGMPLRERL
jgi:hypothetical protein